MKSFRKAYKEAVDGIRIPVPDAEAIEKSNYEKKVVKYRKQKRTMAIATAACAFVLCSVGAAAAAGYAKSVIRTDAYGFRTADTRTAFLNEELEEELSDAGQAGVNQEKKREDVSEDTDAIVKLETCEVQVEEMSQKEYESLEAFRREESIPLAMPKKELLGGAVLSERYLVTGGNFLLVRVDTGAGYFMISQACYAGTSGHSSSTVYPEGVCNERIYTTRQGYAYTMIDSVEEEGMPFRMHAAVSLGDYELIIDFSGYTEEEAQEILEGMDLTVYL